MHQLSASKLQLADQCKYWLTLDWEDESGPAGIEGTRRHKLIETYLRGDPVECDESWFETWRKHCERALPEGDYLIEQAFSFDESANVIALPITGGHRDYSQAPEGSIVGTADLVIVTDDYVHVNDWKSGKTSAGDPSESLQLGFAAYCACKAMGCRNATVTYQYLGDKRVTPRQSLLGIHELVRVRDRLIRIMQRDNKPRVGEHCGRLWCPARNVCPELQRGRVAPRQDSKKENTTMSRMTIASITKGVVAAPICCVLYGPEKVGKSSFAADAPNPIYISEPEGTNHLDVDRFPVPQSWDDVLEALQTLLSGDHEFKTVVVDTADWIEPLIWDDVCKRGGKKSIEDFGYGKGFGDALTVWRDLLQRLDEIRAKRQMNVVVIAHSQVKTFRNPAGDDFDRYELKVHGKAAALLKEWPSAVLFANYETLTSKDSSGRIRGVGTGSRVLHTEHRPAWDAGNRYSLPEELPLSWEEFAAAVKNARPSSAKALLEECAELVAKLDDETKVKATAMIEKAGDNTKQLAKIADRLRAKTRAAA
jgi:hypothetical protein